MKTKSMIIAAWALLAIVPTASAQEQIKELFEKISNYNGIEHIGEQKTATTDADGITNASKIVTVKMSQAYFADLDLLKKAFDNESSHASMVYSYVNDNTSSGVNSIPRRQWSVWRDEAEPVLVGNIKNSSYLMANFDDKEHPGYRTCYAAEWSDTDNSDVRQLKLVYVYGQKPSNDNPQINYNAIASWLPVKGRVSDIQLPDGLKQQLEGLHSLPDSLFTETLELIRPGQPRNIPMNGNMDDWMSKAMNNITHLSNADWHRFFGLLTEKMLSTGTRVDKGAREDLVVAAGVMLDLCKHADKLDEDEREVSAKRLRQVANSLTGNQYVHDLLMLGVKKLEW